MSSAEIAEAEVVESTEVVSAERYAATLWRTDDPATVLKRATETANALAPVLREKNMIAKIGDKDYVEIAGWQTLGSMLGVTAVGVWTKAVDGGWEAKVNAQTLDGRIIGSAEAMCLRAEDNWKDSDEFAIRSMAQTRAASKALASVLRFVVTLAGFSGTPAEEMDGKGDRAATPKAKNYAVALLGKAKFARDELAAIKRWAEVDGKLQKGPASKIIECLKDGTNEGRNELLKLAGFSDTPADESGLGEGEPPDPFEYQGDREDG